MESMGEPDLGCNHRKLKRLHNIGLYFSIVNRKINFVIYGYIDVKI